MLHNLKTFLKDTVNSNLYSFATHLPLPVTTEMPTGVFLIFFSMNCMALTIPTKIRALLPLPQVRALEDESLNS